jgi:hypothetical protein
MGQITKDIAATAHAKMAPVLRSPTRSGGTANHGPELLTRTVRCEPGAPYPRRPRVDDRRVLPATSYENVVLTPLESTCSARTVAMTGEVDRIKTTSRDMYAATATKNAIIPHATTRRPFSLRISAIDADYASWNLERAPRSRCVQSSLRRAPPARASRSVAAQQRPRRLCRRLVREQCAEHRA